MSVLVWLMMGIALWHFTVWVPDRFWGGIVGAFGAALLSSLVFGFVFNGFAIPSREDTNLVQALIAVPAALIGLGFSYWWGGRKMDAQTRA